MGKAPDSDDVMEEEQELSEEVWQKLEEYANELKKLETIQELKSIRSLNDVFKKRREALKSIPKFWSAVLDEHGDLEPALQYRDDLQALSHLTDVWLERDAREPRAFTIELHFSENPYFSDTILKKEFRYAPSKQYESTKDAEGFTEAAYDFDFENDIEPQAIKINWKSDDKNLTKLYPRKTEEDDEEDILDAGSFFNWFEHPNDPNSFGTTFDQDIFPQAIDYYLGRGPNTKGEELDEEDVEADNSGAEEIDLERPKKKTKTG